jgi:glycosyltransferase involved in cell wall biosynthesis
VIFGLGFGKALIKMDNQSVISGCLGIVVIGRNEGNRLIKCLHSVLKVKAPAVYVDSQSSDNSVAEAESLNVTTVILNTSKPINAARARNEGFNNLIHNYPSIQYVHFIDADCELAENWLHAAVVELDKQKQVAVICGRLHEKYRNQSVYMRLCDMDWYRQPGFIDACGGIATYRREIFQHLNGFNETLIAGEEPELCQRIKQNGYSILCLPEDMGTHDSAMLYFWQWWKRCVKIGFGYTNGAEWGGYSKQYRSATIWGGYVPIIILLSLLWTNYSILLLLLYPIQVLRIFLQTHKNNNLSTYDKGIYALFCVLAKFPEMQGIFLYFLKKKYNHKQVLMSYK